MPGHEQAFQKHNNVDNQEERNKYTYLNDNTSDALNLKKWSYQTNRTHLAFGGIRCPEKRVSSSEGSSNHLPEHYGFATFIGVNEDAPFELPLLSLRLHFVTGIVKRLLGDPTAKNIASICERTSKWSSVEDDIKEGDSQQICISSGCRIFMLSRFDSFT